MKLKLLFLTFLFSALSWGQVSITGLGVGNTYSQNFNTASASVPAGWYFYETGSNANTAFSSGTGTANGGDTYFLGNSNEWAFGGLRSGSLVPTVGAAFTNNTGSNITEFVISYVGETWRIGTANRSDRLDFQYSDNATSLSTGTWIDYNTLDYENPGQATGSGSMQHSATITSTITGLNIAPGATFWIRWNDYDAAISDDAMAVDNFSIYANGAPATLADIVLHSNNPAVAASTITQAENNHVIYAFDLAVSSANATLNNVVFNTTGGYAASNITNFKLWYSIDATFDSATDTFLDNETTGLGAGSHTFTGFTRAINSGSTGYFFITTDIPCAATVANDITVSAITTADLTFVSGNKSGTAFASGTHTIVGATPNNVTALATSTCENGAATVSWTLPSGCYDNILVFVSDTPFTTTIPTGNGGAYSASTTFGIGTAFDGGFTAYKGTGTTVTITGLTNGTTYYYKAFTRNGLLWSNGVVVSCTPTMAYCASGSTSSGDSEIENVVLNGENNSINNNTANVCTTGVNDYTAMSADLEVGGTYTLTVEFGDCNGGTQYNGAGGVWIDWNNDGDFDDANETIGTTLVAVSGGNVIQNFTINVPIAQSLGFYRMRIVQRESGTLSNISPCGAFSWGSTEDYTIEVINACTPTTSVSSITPTSGPVGTVVTINGSGFTTATSVSFGSVVASFNIISNTVIKVIVPTGATTGNIVIQDAGSCNLSYSSFTVITKDISSCEGAPITTDLIIYELHDEFTGDGGFITLYNGTAATVNLSNYRIYRAGDYGAAMSNYATLTGSIAPGALGVVTVDAASCGNATNGDLNAGFNENDQIQLRNAAGTIVIDDVHAYIPGPGYYMVRNAGALSARTTFVAADWSTTPLVAGQCIPSAGLVPPSGTGDSPAVTLNPLDVNASCSSSTATLTVAGTEGVAGGVGLAYQWYVNVPGTAGWTAVANGGVYSGATSAALNISSTSGLNNYQYYCQIRENDATCYTATEAAIIKDGATIWNGTTWSNGVPDLTMLAIIDGNYDTALHGDFSCCSLVVNATYRVDVRANNYVEIQNDLTVNGIFKVWDDGSLIQIDDAGVNTGNIRYERITTGTTFDYVYWSSPVNDAVTPSSGFIYSWNPTVANPNGGWGNWILSRNTPMASGVGYIMRDVFSRTFAGVARNGVVQPTIARANNTGSDFTGTNGTTITNKDDNWNLVGNPYPSAISAVDFLNANPNIEGAVRIWTHGTSPAVTTQPVYDSFVYNYTVNDYIVFNATGPQTGPETFNGFIAGGQSFMINMLDGAAASSNVTFNNAMRSRTYNNEQFYRQSSPSNKSVTTTEKHRIWLDLANAENNSTRTLVGYITDATNGKDRLFDAVTNAQANEMGIYSIINNERMLIQGRTLPFDNQDKVQLAVNIPSSGTYSIGLSALDGLFNGSQDIYLEDKELNIIHDLRTSPYTFSIASGEFKDRFVLRYTTETLSNEDFNDNNDVLIFSNQTLNVTSNKLNIKAVTVYNVIGQLLENKKLNNTPNFVSSLVKGNQVLIVRVELENGVTVERKVIF